SLVIFYDIPCPIAHTDESESGRKHHRFLRTGDKDIYPPVIHFCFHTTDAADTIDDEQRVTVLMDDFAECLHRIEYTRRCFTICGEHGLHTRVMLDEISKDLWLAGSSPRYVQTVGHGTET